MKIERPYIQYAPQLGMLMKYSIGRDGKDFDKKLCNSDLRILAMSVDENKVLIGLSDERRLVCNTSKLATKTSITTLISPVAYFASNMEHEEIKQYLIGVYKQDPDRKILEDLTGVCGRFVDEQVDFWITRKTIIFKDGTLKSLPASGVLDLEIGFKIYHIDLTNTSETIMPMADPYTDLLPLDDLITAWQSVYKNKTIVTAILGYFAACMYLPEVVKARGNFPLLGVIGTTRMGKTALLQVLYEFWGLSYGPANYTMTSPFVELMQLCQASCFPIWRDEFRNEGFAKQKESYLRSLYDRTSINKGMATQELKSYSPRGTLLLSGEDVITDPALRRRFVIFQLAENYKHNKEVWEQIVLDAPKIFPQLFMYFMRAPWKADVFERIMRMDLISDNSVDEEKVLYAALGATAGEEYGVKALEEANSFWTSMKNNDSKLTIRRSSAEDFFEFLQDFLSAKGMFTGKTMGGQRIPAEVSRFIQIINGSVRIYVQGLIEVVYKNGFKERTTMGVSALRAMIYEYFNEKPKTFKISGVAVKGCEIELKDVTMESLKMIIENVQKAEQDDVSVGESLLFNFNRPWRQ